MKIIKKNQAIKFKNSETCFGLEYPLGSNDINSAKITIDGRYPEEGSVINLICKEILYVIEGRGKAVIDGQEVILQTGDMLLIANKEKYFLEGRMETLVSCAPAWYKEQHREIK